MGKGDDWTWPVAARNPAALMVNDPALVPILVIIVLPAWLVETGRPE